MDNSKPGHTMSLTNLGVWLLGGVGRENAVILADWTILLVHVARPGPAAGGCRRGDPGSTCCGTCRSRQVIAVERIVPDIRQILHNWRS
jgi:hypothetical protein